MRIYGECPHCGSGDTFSQADDVDMDAIPPLFYDMRHCNACGRDYADVYQLIGYEGTRTTEPLQRKA